MIPMLASELLAETDWKVAECIILVDQSMTGNGLAYGTMSLTSKNGAEIFFRFIKNDNVNLDMADDEINVFKSDETVEMDEIELFIYNSKGMRVMTHDDEVGTDDVNLAGYEIISSIDWRTVALKTKYID